MRNLQNAIGVSLRTEYRECIEFTVEKMLKMRFKRYGLFKGIFEHGLNTFEMRPVADDDKKIHVIFYGLHAAEIRIAAYQYFQEGRHWATKLNTGFELLVDVRKIKPAKPEEVHARRGIASSGMHVVPQTLDERVQKTLGYPQALSFIEGLHHAHLFLWCPAKPRLRQAENGVCAEYAYVNQDEAFEVLRIYEEYFPDKGIVSPTVKDGMHILSFGLDALKTAIISNKPCKVRQLNKRVVPYEDKLRTVTFIVRRLLAFESASITVSRSEQYAFVRLHNEAERKRADARLRTFDFATLISEKDPRCMWVAFHESAAWVFETSKLAPSETIRALEKEEYVAVDRSKLLSYKKEDGLKLLRALLEKVLGWKLVVDYMYTPALEDGYLEFVSIGTLNDDDGEKLEQLKANYPALVKELPRGVTARFQGLRAGNTKSLYVYFVDREILLERKKGTRKAKSVPTKQDQLQENAGIPGQLQVLQTLLSTMDPSMLRAVGRLVEGKLADEQ